LLSTPLACLWNGGARNPREGTSQENQTDQGRKKTLTDTLKCWYQAPPQGQSTISSHHRRYVHALARL
jgi:hypothetical protein